MSELVDPKIESEKYKNLAADLADAPCFIETQFPVAKLSMESYKERKAGRSQTLTGLGKWWGRKPLVLVRAALLGLLMPVSDDPEKDRDIFLKLMTMDPDGLWYRKKKSIPSNRILEELNKMPVSMQRRFLIEDESTGETRVRKFSRQEKDEKDELQRLVFNRLPYAEKLEYCDRPEQIDGPSPRAWDEINDHLRTNASNLTELVKELGIRRFGRIPTLGDAFCGGGSIPFEAARLGCDVYGSDLNPIAALLTLASLKIVGGTDDIVQKVTSIQRDSYQKVNKLITELGVEHNSLGWRADAYLYCLEVEDPETGWRIPLLPTLAIAEKTGVIAKLIPIEHMKRFEIDIVENVEPNEYKNAKKNSTLKDSRLSSPRGDISTPIDVIRRNMRLWENEDIVPRTDDIFQERLYCIRWIESYNENGRQQTIRHYRAPTTEDFQREQQVLRSVKDCFEDWQNLGFIPSRVIESGYNTDQPIRERGWTHWHHLFYPRQLLILGLLSKSFFDGRSLDQVTLLAYITSLGSLLNSNSRLCRWRSSINKSGGIGAIEDTFYNQALNTFYNPPARGLSLAENIIVNNFKTVPINQKYVVEPEDARVVSSKNDIWITDPPYSDAINYHELSEFYLAWYEAHISRILPKWYTDSKRELAVRGESENFRKIMVDCYQNLTQNMPENGMQIVMFTHQDAAIWADLSLILWAAGLRVTTAWTISTETEAGTKQGNYVQGTVFLVLRKRVEAEPVFLDEITHQVETEVRRQLDSMTALEDESDPNFGDADYQLAAYAAALRVLTERPIEEINPEREILRQRQTGEASPIEQLILNAVKIACDHLVPRHLDPDLWKRLEPMERFYIKGLEVESHGEYRCGVYQELARGFGATDYTDLLASTRANETRLKTASEFGRRYLSGGSFGNTLVRQCLFAVSLTVHNEDTREGLNWLHAELPEYWSSRERISLILEYLGRLRLVNSMEHWSADANAANLLAGAVRNDHV
jgi:putative DNA methylase